MNARWMALLVSLSAVGCMANADADGERSTESVSEIKPTGKGGGIYNREASTDARTSKTGGGGTNGMSNPGGPVIHGTVNVYFIWYGNWSGNTATSLLPTLVGDLNGSAYYHINTAYTDSTGAVSGNVKLAGQVNDNYSRGTALADADVQAIVAAHAGKDLPSDTNAVYFVLTSSDVNETGGFCTQYCGWHNHATIGGSDLKYSFVGNPDRCPSSCAAQTTSPNGNAGADGMASILTHELEEANTDPDLNAWHDRRGYENADKCAWTFGTESTASNGSKYNFTGASGKQWLIQQNWVLANGGFCAMTAAPWY